MTPRMRIEVAGLAAYEVLLDRELNTVGRAVDNVGAVYKRIVELQEELGRQRAAEEGGASSSASASAASE